MALKRIPLIHRDISWLYFNERVLQEAEDNAVPLIERLKFLGIYSNNLDEFYRVRVATLKRVIEKNIKTPDFGPFEPRKILDEINDFILVQQERFANIYENIDAELKKENIFIINEHQLCPEHGAFVRKYFHDKVRTNLFPLMLNSISELNALKDKSVYLAVVMTNLNKRAVPNYALVKVPVSVLSRFLVLPEIKGKKYIILLDDVIRYCLNDLFSIFGYASYKAFTVKFSRDSELDLEHKTEKKLLDIISEGLKQRRKGKAIRFVYDKEIPEPLLTLILRKLKVTKKDSIVPGGRYHNFKDFMDFPNLGAPHLEYQPMQFLPHKDLAQANSILDVVRKKDVMIHFPYQSFRYIIDMLREASIDPRVTHIKMTVYRVATNSNVMNALINAARNGKKVTVFLELQARFDEEANILWSRTLEEEGVKVIHGQAHIKVHSKLILIRRVEKGKPVFYANIGTGNFNEHTARIYADESLLTCDKRITKDVERIFELFETHIKDIKTDALILSPYSFRQAINELIDNEIKLARKGRNAHIILKLNSLVDISIVSKLYQASQAGVKIDIIARGICVLMPNYKNYSANIHGCSIVGRFLEHSRIYYFLNGGDEKFYISSADLMKRNLDHRIEVSCPIYNKKIKEELRNILNIQLADNVKSRRLNPKAINKYKKDGDQKVHAQEDIYKYLKSSL